MTDWNWDAGSCGEATPPGFCPSGHKTCKFLSRFWSGQQQHLSHRPWLCTAFAQEGGYPFTLMPKQLLSPSHLEWLWHPCTRFTSEKQFWLMRCWSPAGWLIWGSWVWYNLSILRHVQSLQMSLSLSFRNAQQREMDSWFQSRGTVLKNASSSSVKHTLTRVQDDNKLEEKFSGTPDYASSSALRGGRCGAKDDCESLCYSLFEMWSGKICRLLVLAD